jgi:hypothetical protein
MIYNVIEKNEIIDIVRQLQKLINSYICKTDKTNEIEELTENLFILITKSKKYLNTKDHEELWEIIVKDVEFITLLKPKMKEYPSITNKTIFKHMDINEEINSN